MPWVRSDFAQNVLKLFYGSSLRNLILFLTLPVLTRLYSAEDFGLFQLLLSIIMTFSVVSSLKYEMAIVLPKYRKESDHVIVIALIALVVTTFFFSLLLLIFGHPLLTLLRAEALTAYIPFIIIGIFVTGLVLALRYVLIRDKAFGELSRNNVFQASSIQGISILAGIARPHFLGLFISYIAGNLLAALLILRTLRLDFRSIRPKLLYLFAKKHRKFPLINTISVFINNFSLELPIFMFSTFYGAEIVGFYALAHRLITTPLNLVGTSVGQVYFREATEAFNDSPRRLLSVYKSTVKKLVLVGLIPTVIAICAAPALVKIFLGPDWAQSGIYMQIIIFGLYFGFINAPIGTTFAIIRRQEIALAIRVVSIVVRFLSMYLFRDNPIHMLWALSISASLYYIGFNLLVFFNVRSLAE